MNSFLSKQHEDCELAFNNLWEMPHRQPVSDLSADMVSRLEDLNDRYIVWAANLGVGHKGSTYKKSLDYKLKDAILYKEVVSPDGAGSRVLPLTFSRYPKHCRGLNDWCVQVWEYTAPTRADEGLDLPRWASLCLLTGPLNEQTWHLITSGTVHTQERLRMEKTLNRWLTPKLTISIALDGLCHRREKLVELTTRMYLSLNNRESSLSSNIRLTFRISSIQSTSLYQLFSRY